MGCRGGSQGGVIHLKIGKKGGKILQEGWRMIAWWSEAAKASCGKLKEFEPDHFLGRKIRMVLGWKEASCLGGLLRRWENKGEVRKTLEFYQGSWQSASEDDANETEECPA